jgi:ABC-type molybdate transport system ATPase subunit
LLLDEPLASLDRARKLEILPYLARLRDQAHVPMIYVSHQAGEILKLASLDRARKLEILPYLARLRDEAKVPVIYVSHLAGEIQRLCSRVVRIEDGRVQATGGLELLDAEAAH